MTDFVQRARELRPLIEGHAAEAERLRQIAPPVVDALFEEDFFRLLLPREYGGQQLDPVTFIQTIEAVAEADASTAWVLGQTAGCSMIAAYLEPAVAHAIYDDRRGAIAWGPPSRQQVTAVDGGFRVTATWPFCSGLHHATWLGGAASVDGVERRFLFPRSEVQVQDMWHVMGLRGTGSDAFTVTDHFVPREHTALLNRPSDRRVQAPLYCFSTDCLYSSGFASVALGIARSLLDSWRELAASKHPRDMRTALKEDAVTQSRIGQCEARWAAARAYLVDSVGEVWRDLERGGELQREQWMRIRLASSHAHKEAREVADAAYHAAGSTAIFEDQPFERRFRDIHAVAQQIQARDDHFETVGRYLLGGR
ncbi:MAG: acyl-CoA dehydrogenase family protein [Chloroflexi bacterium]|nr:acyl-CoA dehydrogenase family protein [Chloroflexota bacterium]